jgi:hypothetical protein
MSSVSLANAAIQDLVQKEDKGVAMQLEEKSLMVVLLVSLHSCIGKWFAIHT